MAKSEDGFGEQIPSGYIVHTAQIQRGDKELSIAASFMESRFEAGGENWWAANLATRLGFLVTEHIEIEPEILFSKFRKEDAGFVLSGNLSYNFSPINPEGKTVPFVFGGLGLSNTIMFLSNVTWPSFEDKTRTVLNLGGGLKIFLSRPSALRLEYRFQKFSGEGWDYTYHHILFGISIQNSIESFLESVFQNGLVSSMNARKT